MLQYVIIYEIFQLFLRASKLKSYNELIFQLKLLKLKGYRADF